MESVTSTDPGTRARPGRAKVREGSIELYGNSERVFMRGQDVMAVPPQREQEPPPYGDGSIGTCQSPWVGKRQGKIIER